MDGYTNTHDNEETLRTYTLQVKTRTNENRTMDSTVLGKWTLNWTQHWSSWKGSSTTTIHACCPCSPNTYCGTEEVYKRRECTTRNYVSLCAHTDLHKEQGDRNKTFSGFRWISTEVLPRKDTRITRTAHNKTWERERGEPIQLKHILWNLIFSITATYSEDAPKWMSGTNINSISPNQILYTAVILILQHFLPWMWLYAAIGGVGSLKLHATMNEVSPGGPGDREEEQREREKLIPLKEALKKYVQPNHTLTITALQADFSVWRRGRITEIKQQQQWRNLQEEDLISLPLGGCIIAQTQLQGHYTGVDTISVEAEEYIWAKLQEADRPRWTKDGRRGVMFHRVDQTYHGVGDIFVCKGNNYASNNTQVGLVEEFLRGRGTPRQEPLGCVREAFNFASNKKTEQKEWMEEALYREEHACEEGKYSLDLLTQMCHKYGLTLGETETDEAIGCIQVGHCYDSKYDRLFPHAWAFTKIRGQWYLGDKMEARSIVRKVHDLTIPEPWIHLGQAPRFRLWQSRKMLVDMPYNLYITEQTTTDTCLLPRKRRVWPVPKRCLETEEALQVLAEYVYERQYEENKFQPQSEWDGKRLKQIADWVEEVYYNEMNEEDTNQPKLFQKIRYDPANMLSNNWVRYIIENWIKWEFDEESPEFEDIFHRLYENTSQVELTSEENCGCGTILDLSESTGIPQLRDLGILPQKDMWRNGDLWDPYRSFPTHTICQCGREKNATTYTKTRTSVVILIPKVHLDNTDHAEYLQWRRDGEAMSMIRINRYPKVIQCTMNATYTLDCLPEELKPCLSHMAWMDVNIADIRGIRVTGDQDETNDTCIKGPRGMWLTPVMGVKGHKSHRKGLQGNGILNAYLSLICRTRDQHTAAAEHLAKDKALKMGEYSIAEVKDMFIMEDDEQDPNMVKRNGAWIIKIRGTWWEETQMGMRVYDGLEPTLLRMVEKYSIRCRTKRTTITEFYQTWIQNKKEARLPAWITTKESKGLVPKIASIKLVNALTDNDFPQEMAEESMHLLLPKEYRVPRQTTEYACWFDQQAVVVNVTPTEEITVTWWEKKRMQCVTLGRRYEDRTTEVGEDNKIPGNTRPAFCIPRRQLPEEDEDIVWAGRGFHRSLPKVNLWGRNMTEEEVIAQRPTVVDLANNRTVVEIDYRGLTIPKPMNTRRLKAEKYTIPLSQIETITLKRGLENHQVKIKTRGKHGQTSFTYRTTTPLQWRMIALQIQHIDVLDKVQGSRSEGQWRIKMAAEAALKRARGHIGFPRIAVKRQEPTPEIRKATPTTPTTPKAKRMKKGVIPNTPQRTPTRRLKYTEDPEYQPGGAMEPTPDYIVATWNVRSLKQKIERNFPKLTALCQLLQRDKPDIVFLQETWMVPKTWDTIAPTLDRMGWYVEVSTEGGPGRGQAILTRKTRGPRPVIVRQSRGKVMQAIWNDLTLTNVHMQKRERPRVSQIPGTTGEIQAGDWNSTLHHQDTTLRTTCWPGYTKNENKNRPYDHIITHGMKAEPFIAIRRGNMGRGFGGSDHAAVIRGVSHILHNQRGCFPMWRPHEHDRDLAQLADWVIKDKPTAADTVRQIVQLGRTKMGEISKQNRIDQTVTEQKQTQGKCTEMDWEETAFVVELQHQQKCPEELKEDANEVWKKIKQEQEGKIPLPWPLPDLVGRKEAESDSMNAIKGFFHKKEPVPYIQCDLPEEWKGDWISAWRQQQQQKMTMVDLNNYCKKHKTSTSGTEGICTQTILHLHMDVKEKIVQWINNCLQGEPEAIALAEEMATFDRINLIPKTMPVMTVKNLRPITVSATLLRILLEQIRVQYGRVQDEVVPPKKRRHQFGFTQKHSAKDLSTTLQMFWEMSPDVHLVSVDLEKAYDNLSRDAVNDVMEKQQWPQNYARIIRSATEKAKAEIHYGTKKMYIGAQKRGIKQGAPESPAIFSAILDMVILPLRRKHQTQMGTANMSYLLYADDIIISADTPEEMEMRIQDLQTELRKIGLNINMQKTAYITKTKEARPLFVGDTVIPKSDTLTHLGVSVATPMLPQKAQQKMEKMLTWAMTAGYSRMIVVEVVMAKIMGSINYYMAMTTATATDRNKVISKAENMISEALHMKGTSIQKAVETGTLQQRIAPKVQMAREMLRIWERMINHENEIVQEVATLYVRASTPSQGCPDVLSHAEAPTPFKIRESVKWAMKELQCVSLHKQICGNNDNEGNPVIPWETEEENVILQIHGQSKTITGTGCYHPMKPVWWKQPTKVEWVRTRRQVDLQLNRPLLHPTVPKALLQYKHDPNDVHPIVQLMAAANGLPRKVWTDNPQAGEVLRTLQCPLRGEYTVYIQTGEPQRYMADIHLMKKMDCTPFQSGEWSDPMGHTWRVDTKTKQGSRMWKAMLYAVEELEGHRLVLGGTEELSDTAELEGHPTEATHERFSFYKVFIPVGEGFWAQGDASNPQDGDTVSGMAKMVWRNGDKVATTEVANIHADVPTAEARILLDVLWDLREEPATVVHYVTDCEFVCWVYRWATGVREIFPERRCLWHIVRQLTTAITGTQHKVYVWKTLSHICNPGLRVADDLAKWVISQKTVTGYKPQGVAANLDRRGVLMVRQEDSDLLAFQYVGATVKTPQREIQLDDRFALPTWKGTTLKTHLNQYIAFGTKLRLGTLYPHNWGKDRETVAQICPLCEEEIQINHSVICEQIVAPSLYHVLMTELRSRPMCNEKASITYVNSYMIGAVMEQFTRGIVLQKGMEVASRQTWTATWKKMIPTFYERHRRYMEECRERNGEWRQQACNKYEITPIKKTIHTVEDLYLLLRVGNSPANIALDDTELTEVQIRNVVQREAYKLMPDSQ